jgi:hypothetical protein
MLFYSTGILEHSIVPVPHITSYFQKHLFLGCDRCWHGLLYGEGYQNCSRLLFTKGTGTVQYLEYVGTV